MRMDILDTVLRQVREIGADDWEITDTLEDGWEFYFIRHALDQNRAKKVRHLRVTLYKKIDGGAFLGSAGGEIPVTSTPGESQKLLRTFLSRAEYVRNPYYDLNGPREAQTDGIAAEADVEKTAEDFLRAMESVREDENAFVNSYEIFTSRVEKRFVNSRGIDVRYAYPSSMLETVVNARNREREIEMYRMIKGGSCDGEEVRRCVEESMAAGLDRLGARPTPALGRCPVIFTGEDAAELFNYFAFLLNAGSRYRGTSRQELGKDVVEGAQGDRITLRGLGYLPNSSGNRAFDPEGAPVRDIDLIREGRAVSYWGSRAFSRYLGLEDSFIISNFGVSGGTARREELFEGTCLEAAAFSDFQVDPVTGDMAGEIRLGYLYRNGERIPVTGGSVSGNLRKLAAHMRMTKEERQYDSVRIPCCTRLEDVTVAGCE